MMKNPKHSNKRDDWRTPPEILGMVREVLGEIDLDPASDPQANTVVRARHILTKADNGLTTPWTQNDPISVFINPPSGLVEGSRHSLPIEFWGRLLLVRDSSQLNHAIFLGYSLEQLAKSQRSVVGMVNFPFCVPVRRIDFIDPMTGKPRGNPTHHNVIVYVPGLIDRTQQFKHVFSKLGAVVIPT